MSGGMQNFLTYHARAMWKRLALLALFIALNAFSQTKPDDTPKFNIGAVIYADYTYVASPETLDADGNTLHSSSFNVTRAYINITGNLNHRISFRITPDIR